MITDVNIYTTDYYKCKHPHIIFVVGVALSFSAVKYYGGKFDVQLPLWGRRGVVVGSAVVRRGLVARSATPRALAE